MILYRPVYLFGATLHIVVDRFVWNTALKDTVCVCVCVRVRVRACVLCDTVITLW